MNNRALALLAARSYDARVADKTLRCPLPIAKKTLFSANIGENAYIWRTRVFPSVYVKTGPCSWRNVR